MITTRARVGDVLERHVVLDVGPQQRQVDEAGSIVDEVLADALELGLGAARQAPAQAVGRVPGEVLRGEPAGEAGGTEQDEVELSS